MQWNNKIEPDVSTIYKYLDALSKKVVTPTLIDPTDLTTILNNKHSFVKLPKPTQ